MDVRDVTHHIGAQKSIRGTIFVKNRLGQLLVKETADGPNPLGPCYLGNIG